MSGYRRRPDWLTRLLAVLMAEPHASLSRIAARLDVRSSTVKQDLEVFYRTELHLLPPQWSGVLARLLRDADQVVTPVVRPGPARVCVGYGQPMVDVQGGRQRCAPCAADRRKVRNAERCARLRAERASRTQVRRQPGRPSDAPTTTATVEAVIAREYARARRTFHVDPWAQRGGYHAELQRRGPDTRGLS